MSHTAFTCHALLQQLPVRIECMAVWQQVLLVGTHEGALLLYDVARRPDGGHDARVLDSHKTFGRRAITQLAVVARSNLVLSLSDGCVSVHDIGMQACEEEKLSRFVAHASLQNQAPVLTLRTQLKPRQAHLFAMDVSTPEGRLCVAAKKKLYFYRLAAGGKEVVEEEEECNVVALRLAHDSGSLRRCVSARAPMPPRRWRGLGRVCAWATARNMRCWTWPRARYRSCSRRASWALPSPLSCLVHSCCSTRTTSPSSWALTANPLASAVLGRGNTQIPHSPPLLNEQGTPSATDSSSLTPPWLSLVRVMCGGVLPGSHPMLLSWLQGSHGPRRRWTLATPSPT